MDMNCINLPFGTDFPVCIAVSRPNCSGWNKDHVATSNAENKVA